MCTLASFVLATTTCGFKALLALQAEAPVGNSASSGPRLLTAALKCPARTDVLLRSRSLGAQLQVQIGTA